MDPKHSSNGTLMDVPLQAEPVGVTRLTNASGRKRATFGAI